MERSQNHRQSNNPECFNYSISCINAQNRLSYFIIYLILITSFPTLSTSYTGDYHYVTTEMIPDDAETYCIDTYGTHLATLLTETDLITTQALIGSNSVWVGLKRSTDWEWRDTDYSCNGDSHYCTDINWWANLGEGSRCADMRPDTKLNDWSCTGGHGTHTFICDKRWTQCTGTDTHCHTTQGVLTCDSGYRYTCEWPALLTTHCNLPCTKLTPAPTTSPTVPPTDSTITPTHSPSTPTSNPTHVPSINPTITPTLNPSNVPSLSPAQQPSTTPTLNPIFVTYSPTISPVLKGREGGVNDDIYSTLDNINDSLEVIDTKSDIELMWIIISVLVVVIGCILILIVIIIRSKKSKKHELSIEKDIETNSKTTNGSTLQNTLTGNAYSTINRLSPTSNTSLAEMSNRKIDTQILPQKIVPIVYNIDNGCDGDTVQTTRVDLNSYDGEGNNDITVYQTPDGNDYDVNNIVNQINKTKDMENGHEDVQTIVDDEYEYYYEDMQTTVNDVDVVQNVNKTHGAQNVHEAMDYNNEFGDDEFEVIDDNNVVTTMGY